MKEIELKLTDMIVGVKNLPPSALLIKDLKESNVIKEGIFLGIAAIRKQPIRPEVQKFIDILYYAGNFDYF